MIRDIIHDPIVLGRPSDTATEADLSIAQDLMETLIAHREACVGMAANMIGINKRIIVYVDGTKYGMMLNPQVVQKKGLYKATEGCLSLSGTRETERASSIKVHYQDEKMHWKYGTFSGFTAQIIQHEIDHCNGILI